MVTSGTVLAIYIYPRPRVPAVSVPEVEAIAGRGLRGDHDRGPRRQITLLSAEGWAAASAAVGTDVLPSARRANIVVSGLDLAAAMGKTIRVGDVHVIVHGETKPCERMDEAQPGLRAALVSDWRGGVYGGILQGGRIAVGDAVQTLA